jgi:hypothetical protein
VFDCRNEGIVCRVEPRSTLHCEEPKPGRCFDLESAVRVFVPPCFVQVLQTVALPIAALCRIAIFNGLIRDR